LLILVYGGRASATSPVLSLLRAHHNTGAPNLKDLTMPTASEIVDVKRAIQAALHSHQNRPYFILREFGAVADLRDRVRCSPSLRAPANVHPVSAVSVQRARYSYGGTPLLVDRTQMEISACSRQPKLKNPTFKKSIDLVVLRQAPKLAFGRFGPGDVLKQFQTEDIDVAIEVKTSQSSDPESRGRYVQDIYALLRIRELSRHHYPKDPAHGYFVLIDRNDPVYGHWLVKPQPRMVWNSNAKQKIRFRGRPDLTMDSLNACGIALSVTKPLDIDDWIKCCVLDSTGATPSILYAFKSEGALPGEVSAR
jgi:hypothetical protein